MDECMHIEFGRHGCVHHLLVGWLPLLTGRTYSCVTTLRPRCRFGSTGQNWLGGVVALFVPPSHPYTIEIHPHVPRPPLEITEGGGFRGEGPWTRAWRLARVTSHLPRVGHA